MDEERSRKLLRPGFDDPYISNDVVEEILVKKNMLQLPEGILEDILLRLRVVDLLRLKSVCKRLNSIISSAEFIQLHLKNSIACPSRRRILMPYANKFKSMDYNDIYGEVVVEDLPGSTKPEATLLGTCDGLVTFYDGASWSICIWNPTMGVTKSLKTELGSAFVVQWFGRECVDDDYVFLMGTQSWDEERVKHCYIHVMRPFADEDCDRKTTQKIDNKYHFYDNKGCGTFLDGRVHWPAFDVDTSGIVTPVVFSYDLRRGTVVELPLCEKMYPYTMCVMNGCLSAIQTLRRENEGCDLQIWTMKVYGVKESWTSIAVLTGIRMSFYNGITNLPFLVGVTGIGDLIVNVGGKVLICNLKKNESKTLVDYGRGPHERAIMYVESLVFPRVVKKE